MILPSQDNPFCTTSVHSAPKQSSHVPSKTLFSQHEDNISSKKKGSRSNNKMTSVNRKLTLMRNASQQDDESVSAARKLRRIKRRLFLAQTNNAGNKRRPAAQERIKRVHLRSPKAGKQLPQSAKDLLMHASRKGKG